MTIVSQAPALFRLVAAVALFPLAPAAVANDSDARAQVQVDARVVEDDGAEVRAHGDARALFSGWTLRAATLRYNRADGALSAEGGVTVRGESGDEVRGDRLRYAPETGDGEIANFEAAVGDDNLRASGDRASLQGGGILRAENAVLTSCPADDEDWRIVAAEFEADNNEGRASAANARFEIAGTPVFYFPYAAYGRGDRAGSGPLPPRGRLRDNGVEASLPWRWRISERHDYIVAPAWFSREGWLWKNKLNYDGDRAEWSGEYDWTPLEDRRRSRRRFQHRFRGNDWNARLSYDRVSDHDYLRDLGSPDETSVRNLPHRAEWTRETPDGWRLAAAAERFQTLDDDLSPPHALLPELSAHRDGLHSESGADWSVGGEYAKFVRADGNHSRGGRMLADAEVGRVANFGALSIRPAVGVRAVRYHSLNGGNIGDPETGVGGGGGGGVETVGGGRVGGSGGGGPSFVVPHLQLEGEVPVPVLSSPNRDYRARFGYGYAPYRREQENAPVFDSAAAQRSADNLFHWNRFTGGDRASDAHFVAYGLEGRFWDSAAGRELLFFLVAQRANFRRARTVLPNEKNPPDKGAENLLAEWRARPADFLRISGDAEWSINASEFVRFYNNIAAEFSGGKLLRAGYLLQKEQRGGEEAGDSAFLGGAAPLHPRLDAAVQARYLLDESRLSEAQATFVLRDDCGCWNIFMVAHRRIVRRGDSDTNFSFGVEFVGLGKLGSTAHENLLDWLRDD